MRKIVGSIAILVSAYAYAGGTVGGSPGLALELADATFNVESLPKAYIESDDFRRVQARLSVAGTEAIPALIDGETVDLRTFKDSVVDTKLSKEILPSD